MRATGSDLQARERWIELRNWMKANRHELAAAAGALYPDQVRVEGTRLLGRPEWQPAGPVELGQARLHWRSQVARPAVVGSGDESVSVRPVDDAGELFETYAQAIGALDRPALFEDRPLYRLLGADLRDQPRLDLTLARYFDSVGVGEALAHEFAAAARGGGPVALDRLPLRSAIGDPCDLLRRPASVGVSTLTLRRTGPGQASFLLHWRDPAKVTNAGGLYQVMPVGIFQPADDNPDSVRSDLDLWSGMIREFSEELLGAPEDYPGLGSPIRYERWPFFQRLTGARCTGDLRVWILGLGVDPLTMVTDLLTVAVFDAGLFDEVFGDLVAVNSEGRVVCDRSDQDAVGFAFTESSVARFSGAEPMQAAGAAVLRLALRHRDLLLG